MTVRGPELFGLLVILLVSLPGNVLADGDQTSKDETEAGRRSSVGTLTVHVQDLMSNDGKLRFVMFDSKEDFLKRPVRAEVIEIVEQQGTWTVENLPYGVYAVLVHHDINGSATMERHWYGKPKEPTGASNDAPAKFGPPKFKKAKFAFNSPSLTMTVTVK